MGAGTWFLVVLFGAALFGSASALELIARLVRRLKDSPNGKKKTMQARAPVPGARLERAVQAQGAGQAPPLIIDRRVVRVRLVPRSRPRAAFDRVARAARDGCQSIGRALEDLDL